MLRLGPLNVHDTGRAGRIGQVLQDTRQYN